MNNKKSNIKKSLEEDSINLIKAYSDNIALRGLMQFSPLSAAIDVAIISKYSEILRIKNKVFFSALESAEIDLTQEIIESNEFLHCFFITYNAAMKSRREEKILLFAKVLKNSLKNVVNQNIDQYEEIIQIIEDISYREFLILLKIYELEKQHPLNVVPADNDGKRALRFWNEVEHFLEQELNIVVEDQEAILVRLARTGLYLTFKGVYLDDTKGRGKTTGLLETIIKLLD